MLIRKCRACLPHDFVLHYVDSPRFYCTSLGRRDTSWAKELLPGQKWNNGGVRSNTCRVHRCSKYKSCDVKLLVSLWLPNGRPSLASWRSQAAPQYKRGALMHMSSWSYVEQRTWNSDLNQTWTQFNIILLAQNLALIWLQYMYSTHTCVCPNNGSSLA